MGLPSAPRLAEKWGQKKRDFSERLFSAPIFLPAWFGLWYTRKIMTDTLAQEDD
jgi:hypothetical protein